MADDVHRHVGAILEERARALARPVEALERHEGTQMVVLVVAGERYAVEVRHVREVQPASPPTSVPGVPELWAGVVNVRGGLYPVLDLGRYLGLVPTGADGMLMLVSVTGLAVALLVDDVLEAREIRPPDIRRPLGNGPDPKRKAIRGTTADLVSILDLEALVSDPELTVDRRAV